MSSRNAAASLQSTVALTFRQGIAFHQIALGSQTLSSQSATTDKAFGARFFADLSHFHLVATLAPLNRIFLD